MDVGCRTCQDFTQLYDYRTTDIIITRRPAPWRGPVVFGSEAPASLVKTDGGVAEGVLSSQAGVSTERADFEKYLVTAALLSLLCRSNRDLCSGLPAPPAWHRDPRVERPTHPTLLREQ